MANTTKGNIPKLYEAFKGSFDIGAAVNPRTIIKAGDLIANHYNSLTAENEMKFVSVHPAEDTYTFEEADKIAAFARKNGMKMRGRRLLLKQEGGTLDSE